LSSTFKLDLAATDLRIAQAVYSKSLELPANPKLDLTGAQARIEAAQAEINYRIQNLYVLTTALAYAESTGDWREIPYLVGEQDGPKGKRTDVLIREAIEREQVQVNNAQAQLLAAKSSYKNTATSAHTNAPQLSRSEIALAKAQLEKAQLQATLAAIPPTPLSTPTPTPDKIYSAVTGIIVAIQVTQVNGSATVEIIIDTATDQDRAALNAYRNSRRSTNQKYISPGTNLDNASTYPLPFTPTLTPSAIRSFVARVTPTPSPTRTLSVYPLPSVDAITATVSHITDGDTFIANINGIQQTIRIIGINTPESKKPNTPIQCYAKKAADYLASLIPPGTVIQLQVGRAPQDKYNRLLAYVWKGDQSISELLLINGYARALAIKPNIEYAAHYAALMQQAQHSRAGMWGICL
jgi:micrococcal nuclease